MGYNRYTIKYTTGEFKMISYIFLLLSSVIGIRYGYQLYRGRIDFSGFLKKKDMPMYTNDLKGKIASQLNSSVYIQFLVLYICWPLFLIKNPYHFMLQLLKQDITPKVKFIQQSEQSQEE